MSFRTRLISFFLVIVVVPMVAIGILVFRLISDSAEGKADARANGIASTAASIYASQRSVAAAGAQTIARNLAAGPDLRARIASVAGQSGLARVRIRLGRKVLADFGDRTALAPGVATVEEPKLGGRLTVIVSVLSASDYVRDLAGPGIAVDVTQAGRTLGSSLPGVATQQLPRRGTTTVAGARYRTITQSFPSFNGELQVTVLSALSSTTSSLGTDRLVAAAFIVGFLVLALSFSVLASRALQGQLGRFLQAARRLAGGDFTSPVPTEGHDEFAELGTEFNNMSAELEHKLGELSEERRRLRDALQRIGQTFAANLDRPVLLELALRTAIDFVSADAGRLSVRSESEAPLAESTRIGSLDAFSEQIYAAEREALKSGALGESSADAGSVATVALRPVEPDSRVHGLITVARRSGTFDEDDRYLLQSLASQATLALENVELHFQVRRQAVTDELTGLANHGRFQELLSAEIEQVRRYHHPVGLIMLDIDNFKAVNDTYGHQQGDVVLRHVARVLSDSSRETDTPARYGGEELALVLPHTDLEGSHAIAERVRESVEALRIPRLDRDGFLRITASVGVAASSDGEKDALIADADNALYTAKRQGKNRTVKAQPTTANVFTAE